MRVRRCPGGCPVGWHRSVSDHPQPVDRMVNPPPERPAEANDGVPEPRQGQSVSGEDLRPGPGIDHLTDGLPAVCPVLCRHEKT